MSTGFYHKLQTLSGVMQHAVRYIQKIAAIVFFCFLGLLASPSSWAANSLTVLPIDGDTSLRFSRTASFARQSRQVKIRINSDLSKKYEIRQRLLDPLRNDQGVFIDREAINFYTLQGSNASGSLYQLSPVPLDTMEQVIYTSSANGNSDSFIVAYEFDNSKINASGNFLGRILYTLKPIEGGMSEETFILNVYLTIEQQLEVKITTSSQGADLLRISASDNNAQGNITISLTGKTRERIQIIQQIEEPLRNEKNESFPNEALSFLVSAQTGQTLYASPTNITLKTIPIYTSDAQGENDIVTINFNIDLNRLNTVGSGIFQGMIVYTLESNGVMLKRLPLKIQINIERVFEIAVEADTAGGLYFSNVTEENSPIEKEVILKIKTNMTKPYSIVQKMAAPLTNNQGDVIPAELFTYLGEIGEGQKGEVLCSQWVPVKLGDTVVFNSNANGDASVIRMKYSLKVPIDTKAGDYRAQISYALVEH
ncbi:MAG: hypothetical protein WCI77_08780 [Candidatus Omnitrophota bacterium]